MTDKNDPEGQSNPTASRPYMPGYGIQDAASGRGLLPWSWAVERLTQARSYWVATARPDGRPHAMPVWGVWMEEAFYFSCGQASRKARNLALNPACVVGCEPADEAVILEGRAELVTDPLTIARFAALYGPKYGWNMEGFAEPVYRVRPVAAFAFLAAPGEFTGSATRWTFPE